MDSAANLLALFDHSMQGVVSCNTKGVIESINPAASEILGYEQKEAIGMNFWDLLKDPHLVTENFSEMDDTEPASKYEVYAHHKNGTERLIELRIVQMENRYFGIFHDVTKQAQVVEALSNTTFILDTITRVESQFIIQKEKSNIDQFFHELLMAAMTITKSKEGLLAQINGVTNPLPFIHSAVTDKTLVTPYLEEVISKGEAHFTKIEQHYLASLPLLNKNQLVGILVLKKENYPFHQETIHFILPILQTTVLLIENYEREVERKRAREMLRERDEKLSTYVEILAKKNQELEVARDQALAASRAKSAFLANMSHEMRTPLNGILGLAELLMNTELNRQQNDFAHKLYSSGEILLKLINDILDLSKIEAGQLKLEKISFNLTDLIHEVVELITPKATEKNLQLKIAIDKTASGNCVSDPFRLRQVLLNLLSNAIKFTEKGFVELRVAKKEERVRFEIQDSGIGIPEEKQSALFTIFYQADSSTTRKYGGTGLGLAISRQLVEAMGGEIGVESREGQGTTFWFEIKDNR